VYVVFTPFLLLEVGIMKVTRAMAAASLMSESGLRFHPHRPRRLEAAGRRVAATVGPVAESTPVTRAVTPSLGCDWGCLARKAPSCLSCGTDIWCWIKCAGGAAWDCCSIF
jgi:hypothetical protein